MINEVPKFFGDLIDISGGQKSGEEKRATTNAKTVSMNNHFDLSVLILKGLLVAFQR